jgi:hypothetical protein
MEILAPGGHFGGDLSDVFDPGDNFGMDEHHTGGHVSLRHPRRNWKKKQRLVIDFENRCHNIFVCLKSQDMRVRAYKCTVAWKRMKYHQRLEKQMEESDCMSNAMELRQDVPTVEQQLDSPLSHFI